MEKIKLWPKPGKHEKVDQGSIFYLCSYLDHKASIHINMSSLRLK